MNKNVIELLRKARERKEKYLKVMEIMGNDERGLMQYLFDQIVILDKDILNYTNWLSNF